MFHFFRVSSASALALVDARLLTKKNRKTKRSLNPASCRRSFSRRQSDSIRSGLAGPVVALLVWLHSYKTLRAGSVRFFSAGATASRLTQAAAQTVALRALLHVPLDR